MDWSIWLCEDCLDPMTEFNLYVIQVLGVRTRACYDCWSLRGCPNNVYIGGTWFVNRRSRRRVGCAYVHPVDVPGTYRRWRHWRLSMGIGDCP